ncbi:cyclase family protein [Dictyobacter formicarum]|uniref:Cyclase n=1 Tax=Dictyobacter formicarum TaxID=2778368 RepID=A0ABQ3VUL7_9CHLR|nr:cyclase family protein [Dictyobacter formicarum]GHO89950.1 hypothetical protein KSZ_79560 [Dictyobacter formicarum]
MDSLIQSALNAQVYDLEQPRYFGAPILPSHAPGFVYTLHRRHEPGLGEARTGASGYIYMAEHAGTHIDALTHQAENLRLYGGREVNSHVQTSTGFTEMGSIRSHQSCAGACYWMWRSTGALMPSRLISM